MKKMLIFFALVLIQTTYAQQKELTIVVKSIALDEVEGSQSPYINYVDDKGQEQWFSFILPMVGMGEYAEITIEGMLLIKVSSTYRFGDGPNDSTVDGYELHEDVANSLVGKKIKITYEPVDLTAYLYSIEIIN